MAKQDTVPPRAPKTTAKPPAKKATATKSTPAAKTTGRPTNDSRVLKSIERKLVGVAGFAALVGFGEDAEIFVEAVPAISADMLEIAKRHKWLYDALLESAKMGPYLSLGATMSLGVVLPIMQRHGMLNKFPPILQAMVAATRSEAIAPRPPVDDDEPSADPTPPESPVVVAP